MKFLNDAHEIMYHQLAKKIKLNNFDIERKSLLYIISSSNELFKKRELIYDFNNDYIKINIFKNKNLDLASSSKALVRLAFNLFNGYVDKYTNPLYIFCYLDDEEYTVANNAIDIRFFK